MKEDHSSVRLELARLAYERAIDAVDHQVAYVERLRQRSASLLAFVATVSVFLVREAVRDASDVAAVFSGGGILAAIASLLLTILVVGIYWPQPFKFEEEADALLDDEYAELGLEGALSALVEFKTEAWRFNNGRIAVLQTFFRTQVFISIVVLIGWGWRSIRAVIAVV